MRYCGDSALQAAELHPDGDPVRKHEKGTHLRPVPPERAEACMMSAAASVPINWGLLPKSLKPLPHTAGLHWYADSEHKGCRRNPGGEGKRHGGT